MRTLVLSAVALASLGVQSPAVHTFPLTFTISGTLTHADYERLIEHPFDVPSGARRVEVTLTATGAERRTVIDLGLRDPEGVRGWSGGRTTTVAVSRLSATPGYLPGSVQPGRWAVLLGVPNISPLVLNPRLSGTLRAWLKAVFSPSCWARAPRMTARTCR